MVDRSCSRPTTAAEPASLYSPLLMNHQPITVRSGDGALQVVYLPPPPKTPRIQLPDSPLIHRKKFIRIEKRVPSYVLGEKLMGDVMVAASVTFVVTPFLTVVDKAIVQRAAGTHTLVQSGIESIKSIFRNPVSYVKSPTFLIMWGTYAATYSAANSLKTIFEHRDYVNQEKIQADVPLSHGMSSSSKIGIFTGTAIVNSAASLMKDKAYARMFGTTGAAATVPMVSYGLWIMRDGLVVGSSFLLPEMVSHSLQDYTGLDQSKALRLSQLLCPVATQFLVGPIHLLALDFYNRPLANLSTKEATVDRVQNLGRGVGAVIAARIARIAPGYGLGGVLNTHFRDMWRDHLIQKEVLHLERTQDATFQKESVNRLVELVTERNGA